MKNIFSKNKPLVVILVLSLVFISLFLVRKNVPQKIQEVIPEIVKKEETGTLSVQIGQASIKSGTSEKTLSENQTADVINGSTISTSETGIATLRYSSGTVVRIAPSTTLAVTEDIETKTLNLVQEAGNIFVRFKAVIGVTEELDVTTPTAVATVRGTKLMSRIDAKFGESKFISVDREFNVYKKDPKTNKRLENSKQILKEGMQAQIGKAGLVRLAKQALTEEEKKSVEESMKSGKGAEIEWGNQIRSYVLHPYKMVKDHRTNVETANVDAVLEGNLDLFIEGEKDL